MGCSFAAFYESDGATVASTTEVSTLPATNLFIRTPFDRWRSTSASGHVTVTYASSFAVDQLVLLYTNGSSAGTVRFRAGTNSTTVTSAPAFDSGALDHQPGSRSWTTFARTHFLLDLGTAVTQLCWRVDVTQGAGSDYEAARVGFLRPWRPSRGVDWGDVWRPIDTSIRRRSRNGTAHIVRGGLYREVDFTLKSTSSTEFSQTAAELRRRVEARVPIFYAKSPRALSLGNSPTGGIAMYTDPDVMDNVVYSYLREPFPTENEIRAVKRLVIGLDEVVHP